MKRERSPVSLLFTRTPVILGYRPTLMPSFNLNYLLKDPSPDTVTLGVGISKYEFGGNTIQSTTLTTLHNFS